MPQQHELFSEPSLSTQLDARRQRVTKLVDSIPQDQFLLSSDDQIIAYVEHQMHITPLELQEDAQWMSQDECQIDISNDRSLMFYPHHQGPLYVPGTRIVVNIPFTGESWIFRYQPSTFLTITPFGSVKADNNKSAGLLVITIEHVQSTGSEQFKQEYDRNIDYLRRLINYANNDINQYNTTLPGHIQDTIRQRRIRLEKHKGIADLLNIPLQAKPDAPSIQPIHIEPRPQPRLSVSPKTGLKPEPGISVETYEQILNVIRHEARSYEATPGTYAKFDEEELRDVIRGHLNTYFQGRATGETFRGKGKTDLCIEEENRAAFVGECKVWQGAGQIHRALDQLLGYLTWRDSKAALIMFNKSIKDFSSIVNNLPASIETHPCFIEWKTIEQVGEGEWRALMRSHEDEGRTVFVHIFAINIFTEKRPSKSRAK